MENTQQKQFEFKLLREDVKADYEKKVKELTRESSDQLESKVAGLKAEFNRRIMEICKLEDEWRAESWKNMPKNSVSSVVSPYTDENGNSWVHIKTGKYDFLLGIRDLADHEVKWEEAMQLAKDNGVALPTKEMWSLVGAFLPEINAVIEQLGGDILDDWYWSASEYVSNGAWIFIANVGSLGTVGKMDGNSCRGSLALNS